MSLPIIQAALNAGELSPALFGRVDLDKYKKGLATCRNFYASYRGGASTRAGTLFCGQCKQGNQNTALSVAPPRNIDYQFSATQGITLEFGDSYLRFVAAGAYITEAPIAITGVTNANPGVVSVANSWSNGDEVFITGIAGTIGLRLNNRSYLVANQAGGSITLVNPLTGAAIDTTYLGAYGSGGTAARIYTLATPYAAVDLPYLKYAQSADVMSLTCVNTATRSEYSPYDLARIESDSWTLTATKFGSSIAAPASIALTEQNGGGTSSFWYPFVATAVNASTGEESVASPVGIIETVDIAVDAATITITCASVPGAGSYNFYGATESYGSPPSPGGLFGYLGSAFGPSFTDTNIIADFTVAPPLHTNPFATSSVTGVVMTNFGTTYSTTATTAAATSPIGQNAILVPIVVNHQIVWTAVTSGGAGYTGGEAVVFVDGTGAGGGATATLQIGPATGTFPGCVSYFQQRRFYAATLNQPDTYFASQPGAFTNMDTSLPVEASDAIVGSPWSQQVNGIQWMLNMPGGLVIFTGLGAWQLSGAGQGLATSAAITPENQVANPQAYNGCSPLVPPIPINYDILYVQEKGSIIRDLSYNFFVNIYTGTDLTVLSNHLFDGYTIVQWGWSEEPNKLLWVVRNDNILLCLTYLKEQDVYAWTRHDTNGLFQSVCTVSEPPVNAPYFVVLRCIQNDGNPVWAYFQERMDNRLWADQIDSWCVDAGLSLPQNAPNATITASSSYGVPTLGQPQLVYGGANYSGATFAEITDPTGSGAVASVTVVAGAVTAASVSGTLTGYTMPVFTVIDPTGAGGGAAINIFSTDVATVSASSGVFANSPGNGEVGDVINIGLWQAVVTAFSSSTSVTVNVLQAHRAPIPDDPLFTPIPALAGQWTIVAPVSTVYGLDHLEGMTVSILADGVIVQPQVVTNGQVQLPEAAATIVVGLGYTCQVQTMYLEVPGQVTVQGRRKEVDSVVVRIDKSGTPFQVGVNQIDASTQPGQVNAIWSNMTPVQGNVTGSNTPLQPYGFNSADIFVDVYDQVGETGAQIAVQQVNPVPLNVLALVPWVRIQDDVDSP